MRFSNEDYYKSGVLVIFDSLTVSIVATTQTGDLGGKQTWVEDKYAYDN